MATDIRGHTAPIGTEQPRRSWFNQLSLSVNDIVGVANATARAALVTSINADPNAPAISSTHPLICRQADTGQYWETIDGTNWTPITSPGLGQSWTVERTSGLTVDNFVSGSFAGVMSLALPSSAPAGRYLVIATFILSGSAAATGNARVLFNSANILADPFIGYPTLPTVNTFTKVYTYSGGACTVDASAIIGTGTGSCYRDGTRMQVIYLGV